MTTTGKFQAVLFDLDGTLVDTAPDLCGTIQDMQSVLGVDITALADMTHLASGGARALLKKGFGLEMTHPDFPRMREEFLSRYEARIASQSAIYSGLRPMLNGLEHKRVQWGIVTNKPYYLAEKLVHALDLARNCGVLVGGDTAEKPKPSPLPCLWAADQLGVDPSRCVMVGDDERDIVAGKAAGMTTVAVGYGYIASPIEHWQADVVLNTTLELVQWLEQNT